jgi:hypothetical protein
MFRLFSRLQASEQQLLAPFLDLARQKHGYDRRVWLNELRCDAPTVAARLEAVLAAEAEADVAPIGRAPVARDHVASVREFTSGEFVRRPSVA